MDAAATISGGVAAAIAYVLALLVLATAPGRSANRRLALVLGLEGALFTGLVFLNVVYDGGAQPLPRWFEALLFGLNVAIGATYLVLLSSLDTPIVRPFRHLAARIGLVLFVASVAIGGYVYGTPAGEGEGGEPAAIVGILGLAFIVGVAMFGIVAALSARRGTAPRTRARAQATAFLAAFATRDVGWGAGILLGVFSPEALAQLFWMFGPQIITILYVPILAYGLLRQQLFDIDLKIKTGISRSTVATLGLVVVLAAAKVAEFYLSKTFGFIAGGIAAGILLVLAPRLNRIGDKVASAALPKAENTPAYMQFRKLEVYQAALESALEGGEITPKERAMIGRLRAKLGIAEDDARVIEADVRERLLPRADHAPS